MSGAIRWVVMVSLVALSPCLTSWPSRAADALESYRALPREARRNVLVCARSEIAHALVPAAVAAATPVGRDSTVRAATDTAARHTPDWPAAPCGVYLSLAHGTRTRACVGSLTPLGGTLRATLRELARRVISDDPRHPPVRGEEMDSLAVLVSFAGPPEPIDDPMSIAPGREGLLISTTRGSIAFLPGEARTVSWALGEARRVGILQRMSDASFQRFDVVVLRDRPVTLYR